MSADQTLVAVNTKSMILVKEFSEKLNLTGCFTNGLTGSTGSTTQLSEFTPMSNPPNFKFPEPAIPQSNSIIKQSPTAQQDQQKQYPDYLKLILNARVYDVAIESPLHLANKLSIKLGNKIYLKREDLQPIFSFKCRGAYNRMYQLSLEEKQRGVIAVSAGNHAQGVALAAQKMGIKATIVMPTFAPEIKVESVKRLGANIVLTDGDLHEARKECFRLRDEHGYTFIPPFDDPYVIAGQGTVGVEILRQIKQDHLDAIFVCCGGGGLLAGIAAFVKRIRPEVKVIGVNTVDSDSMYKSLHAGHPVQLSEVGLFSDGTAVREVGQETFRLCKEFVDDFVLVPNDEICAAIKDTFEDTRSVLEPSGALAVAGCKRYLANNPSIKDGVFVAVASGANVNFDRLRFVAERAKLGDNKEALLSVLIPEYPGSFLRLYQAINPRSVIEFSYRYSNPTNAHVYIACEIDRGTEQVSSIIQDLKSQDMEAIDITENEMAKTHARYLAGGRSSTVSNELVYRFNFAERPGALQKFLVHIEGQPMWNISLFHYRNHGSDVGRVLVGFQVPPQDKQAFTTFLSNLNYFYCDETENPVYTHFLK